MEIVNALAGLSLSLLAGLIPAGIYGGLAWWMDRYEKEPRWLLALAFLWGAVPAILLSLLIELTLGLPVSVLGKTLAEAVETGGIAPVVEEVAKGAFLVLLFLVARKEIDDVLDGIVYGAFIGLGFAFAENLLYFVGAYFEGGLGGWTAVVFLRAVVFGLNHAFFTAVTGAALGLARQSRGVLAQLVRVSLGFALAMFFHAVHNLGAALAQLSCFTLLVSLVSDWGGVGAILIVVFMSHLQEKGWLCKELGEEVDLGTITMADYLTVTSSWQRAKARYGLLLQRGWEPYSRLGRFYQLASELAFRKHQLRAMGDQEGLVGDVETLRREIAALRG
ncbi:MAG: PrsW family intramembrane metalloprotease [Chloroflexota bacterium]